MPGARHPLPDCLDHVVKSRPRQIVQLQVIDRRWCLDECGWLGVRRLADQEPDDRLVDFEEPPQERRLAVLLIVEQIDELVIQKWSAGREQAPRGDLFRGAAADQIERQIDAGPFPRYVDLEVGINRFVAGLELRGEGDQQQVDLGRRELKHFRQVRQAQPAPRLLGEPALLVDALPGLVELLFDRCKGGPPPGPGVATDHPARRCDRDQRQSPRQK